jgi:ABC-type branched-subunit amino acid transport system substrate-binding protein
MSPKTRFISIAAVVAALFVFVIVAILYSRVPLTGWGSGEGSTEEEGARVAVLLNLTGPAARFDAPKQKTIQIAQERIATLYPHLPFAVRVLDAGGGPEGAIVAVRRATEWGATWYLSGTSPTALAIAAQVRDREPAVVQLANAANPDFGPPRSGEYRFWPDWRQEAGLIVRHLLDGGMRRVLLFYSADPYSTALSEELRAGVAEHGVALSELQFDPAATPDFRPPLIRATNDGTDAVVIFGLPPGLTALFSQMSEAGWAGTTIGGVNTNVALSTYDELNLTGPLWLVETESMIKSPIADSEVARFRTAYQQTFNDQPAFYSLYLADALYFVGAAMSPPNAFDLSTVAAANAVTDFNGASGEIRVLPDRTLEFKMRLIRAR